MKEKRSRSKTCIVIGIIMVIVGILSIIYNLHIPEAIENQSKVNISAFNDSKKELGTTNKGNKKKRKPDVIDNTSSKKVSIKLYKEMKKYNKDLVKNQDKILISEGIMTKPFIDLSKYGITNNCVGEINIPKINCKLPIYLGASDIMMSYGVTHVNCTSAPIGGKNTNSVICGHTGYIGVEFFDRLPELNVGDTVKVENFWNTLKYRVIETKVVIKNESSVLYIQKGKDLLTLFTCISNRSGGFDRFVVVCERI